MAPRPCMTCCLTSSIKALTTGSAKSDRLISCTAFRSRLAASASIASTSAEVKRRTSPSRPPTFALSHAAGSVMTWLKIGVTQTAPRPDLVSRLGESRAQYAKFWSSFDSQVRRVIFGDISEKGDTLRRDRLSDEIQISSDRPNDQPWMAGLGRLALDGVTQARLEEGTIATFVAILAMLVATAIVNWRKKKDLEFLKKMLEGWN
jgi:hypothetical protein